MRITKSLGKTQARKHNKKQNKTYFVFSNFQPINQSTEPTHCRVTSNPNEAINRASAVIPNLSNYFPVKRQLSETHSAFSNNFFRSSLQMRKGVNRLPRDESEPEGFSWKWKPSASHNSDRLSMRPINCSEFASCGEGRFRDMSKQWKKNWKPINSISQLRCPVKYKIKY